MAPYIKQTLCNSIIHHKLSNLMNQLVPKVKSSMIDIFSTGLQNMMRLLIVNCGSFFVGHCTHEQLIEHYYEFSKNLKLDSSFLLHLGMGGPSVNNAFQQKLFDELHEKEGTSFLNLGTCFLHRVRHAYQTALKEFKFDFDQFAVDSHSFFKLSSAIREDYMRMEEV